MLPNKTFRTRTATHSTWLLFPVTISMSNAFSYPTNQLEALSRILNRKHWRLKCNIFLRIKVMIERNLLRFLEKRHLAENVFVDWKSDLFFSLQPSSSVLRNIALSEHQEVLQKKFQSLPSRNTPTLAFKNTFLFSMLFTFSPEKCCISKRVFFSLRIWRRMNFHPKSSRRCLIKQLRL